MSVVTYKYELPQGEGLLGSPFLMPNASDLVSVGQDSLGRDAVYFAVDTAVEKVKVQFARVNTGHQVPQGSVVLPLTTTKNESHIRHLYLVVEPVDTVSVNPEAEPEPAEEFDGTLFVGLFDTSQVINILDGYGDSAHKLDVPGMYRLVITND